MSKSEQSSFLPDTDVSKSRKIAGGFIAGGIALTLMYANTSNTAHEAVIGTPLDSTEVTANPLSWIDAPVTAVSQDAADTFSAAGSHLWHAVDLHPLFSLHDDQ